MLTRHILFPTDFSNLAKEMEISVRHFAGHFGARLTILHVIEMPSEFYGIPSAYFLETPDFATLVHQAREVIKSSLSGYDADRIVTFGDPAAVIADLVKTDLVDLVMMPTRGYGPFRRALIGSVTAKVLHDTKCAVWTTAHTERYISDLEPDPSVIVCAIDLSVKDAHVVKGAAKLANSFGARLLLAHAVSGFRGPSNEIIAEQNQARQEIAKIQERAGTQVDVFVQVGPIAAVIADIARCHNADLVIMGRGAIENIFELNRSDAYSIILEGCCPVLSL